MSEQGFGRFERGQAAKTKLTPELAAQLGLDLPPPPASKGTIDPDPLASTAPPQESGAPPQEPPPQSPPQEPPPQSSPQEPPPQSSPQEPVLGEDGKPIPQIGEEGYKRPYALPTPEEAGEPIMPLGLTYDWSKHPGYDMLRGYSNAIMGHFTYGQIQDEVELTKKGVVKSREPNPMVSAVTDAACSILWNMSRDNRNGKAEASLGGDLFTILAAGWLAKKTGTQMAVDKGIIAVDDEGNVTRLKTNDGSPIVHDRQDVQNQVIATEESQ